MRRGRIERTSISIPTRHEGETIQCELDRLDVSPLQPFGLHTTQNNVGDTDDNMKKDVVVLCHGQWSSKYDPLMMAISEGLLRFEESTENKEEGAGIKRSHAESLEVCRFTFSTVSTEPFSGYLKECEALDDVVHYLESKLSKRVVAVVGHSKAAATVCFFASSLANGKARTFSGHQRGLVCISGRYSFHRLEGVGRSIGQDIVDKVLSNGGQPQLVVVTKKKPFWLTIERLEERASIDMETIIKSIESSHFKLCVVHGDRDERIPASAAESYVKAFRGEAWPVKIVEQGNHSFSDPSHRREVVTHISEFVHKEVFLSLSPLKTTTKHSCTTEKTAKGL